MPEFTGKWLGTPPGIDYKPHTGQHPPDPYKNEKPLFTIPAENLAQYAERLTRPGSVLFRYAQAGDVLDIEDAPQA